MKLPKMYTLPTRLLVVCVWTIAIFLALGAPFKVLDGTEGKRSVDFQSHPRSTSAVVVNTFINGLGGDLNAQYKYTVNGHGYQGYGEGGELGNKNTTQLKPGDVIAIEYSALDPSLSCPCNIRTTINPPYDGSRDYSSLTLLIPLVIVIGFTVFRRHKVKRTLSERVDLRDK